MFLVVGPDDFVALVREQAWHAVLLEVVIVVELRHAVPCGGDGVGAAGGGFGDGLEEGGSSALGGCQ